MTANSNPAASAAWTSRPAPWGRPARTPSVADDRHTVALPLPDGAKAADCAQRRRPGTASVRRSSGVRFGPSTGGNGSAVSLTHLRLKIQVRNVECATPTGRSGGIVVGRWRRVGSVAAWAPGWMVTGRVSVPAASGREHAEPSGGDPCQRGRNPRRHEPFLPWRGQPARALLRTDHSRAGKPSKPRGCPPRLRGSVAEVPARNPVTAEGGPEP